MKEALILPVVCPADDEDHELMIVFEDNVLEFHLGGVLLFSGDYDGNFADVFERMRAIWGASN